MVRFDSSIVWSMQALLPSLSVSVSDCRWPVFNSDLCYWRSVLASFKFGFAPSCGSA